MKVTCLSTHGCVGRIKFIISKKRLADSANMNTPIASDVAKALKFKKKYMAKAKYDSKLDNKSEHSSFEKLDIIEKSQLGMRT